MEKGAYIVFFDLDGTLSAVNSGYALIKTARSQKKIGFAGVLNAIALSVIFRLHILPVEKIISRLGQWLRGADPGELSAMGRKAVDRYLASAIFGEAKEEINRHRAAKAEIAILSSAIMEICSPVAEILQINNVICTRMEVSGGRLTGQPSGRYCFGGEKKERILQYCEERGYERSAAYCYADSVSDLPALESVGNPVCVNPGRKLQKIALKRGWKCRKWNI